MDKTAIETLLTKRHAILAEIAQRQTFQASLRAQIQTKIDALIPQELKTELAALKAEMASVGEELGIDDLQAKADALKADIKKGVLEVGETVKAEGCGMAVYVRGSVTWDSAGLDGASKLHPELLVYRKVGEPSVSFRDK